MMSMPMLMKTYRGLTPEGTALVAFIEKRIRELGRSQLDSEAGSGDQLEAYRAYFAAVVKSPPKMTALDFFTNSPTSQYTRRFWDDYLLSLSPIDAARASTPTQEATARPATSAPAIRLNESVQEHQPMNTRLTYQEQTQLAEYLRKRARSERGLPYTDATAVWTDLVEARNMPAGDFFKSFDAIGRELYALMMDDVADGLGDALEQIKG